MGTPIMIRNLFVLGAVLAFVSSAQAQTLNPTSQTIQIDGQNAQVIRAQLKQAAAAVCNAARDPYAPALFDDETTATCVSDTYATALRRAVHLAPDAFRGISVRTVATR